MNLSPQQLNTWYRYKWITRAIFKVILIAFVVSPAVARHRDDANRHEDPFEPTVSSQEAKLLHTAMTKAGTDKTAALEMLNVKNLADASPAIDFAIGNLYFQREELDAAAEAYQNAIRKLPKFRSAIMNLGRVYLLQQQTGKAITLYQQLAEDGQANADILLLLGHALLMENYPVSAEVAYQQTLLLRPKHPDAMLGMAKSLMQQERYEQGLALIGELLQQDPIQKELWSLRTNAYLAMGAYERATRSIEVARRLGCADIEMLATLGDLYLNRNQPEDALAAYKIAFRKESPSATRMLRAMEGFIIVGSPEGAERMLACVEGIKQEKSATFSLNDQIKLLRLKGELAQQKGESEQANALYEELLRIDPLDAKAMLLLAKGLHQKGNLEQAAIMCERAARIEGFEADALVLHAQIEVGREHYADAVELLEAAQTFVDRPFVKRYLDQVRRMAR